MDLENTGKSFPRCRPVARIWSWTGGHWRIITTTGFQDISSDIGVIPGAKLKIKTDLQRSLPPGKYKIAGELFVDGRRTRRVSNIVDFAGDPEIKSVAVDAALDLEPRELTIKSQPGANRVTVIKVQNGADETVNVEAALRLPPELVNKFFSGIVGNEMDCAPWISIEPRRFTLKGEGATQTVRITTSMPASAVKCPNYYSNLEFWSSYPDGQNAGVTIAKLSMANPKNTAKPVAEARKLMTNYVSGSKYQIVGGFSNLGKTHFTPIKCKAAITGPTETIPRISALLQSPVRGYMLPLESRDFTGVIDLASLDPGTWLLSVGLKFGTGENDWVYKQHQIKVTTEGLRRVVETTGTQEDLKQLLEVKWTKTPAKAITSDEKG